MARLRDFHAFHPFVRLAALLGDSEPGKSPTGDGQPLMLQVGEPRRKPPEFLVDALVDAKSGFSQYPPPRGNAAYVGACRDWLGRRFDLPEDFLSPASNHILPVPGTKEGLFFAALALVPVPEPGEDKPAVLLPNPFYHVYAGAAVAAGADPVFVPAGKENGHLPDFSKVDPKDLARAALCYYCSPSNPQGAVADEARLAEVLATARRHDFAVVFDECYCELYFRRPPPSVLQVAAAQKDLSQVLCMHSLSKRSSAAGLRCGFVAGDKTLVDRLDVTLRVGGAGLSVPNLAAGAALWNDDEHVLENRKFYQDAYAMAEDILGRQLGNDRAEAGFFLWLPVEDAQSFTLRAWQEAGIKVLPGTFMTHTQEGEANAGDHYIRAALVYDPAVMEPALSRIRDLL